MRAIETVRELESIAERYASGFLFRGQTKHYIDTNGNANITTSFSRNGCIPPQMQKWILYAEEILYCLKGPEWRGPIELQECQSLLQHYGWRSFFLDFTSSLEVACWFASNVYNEKRSPEIVEDWSETGLMVRRRNSNYDKNEEDGFIYIVDLSKLSKHEIGIHNIERFKFSDFDSRIERQQAVIVGPLHVLPNDAIVEQLRVTNSVLNEYSSHLHKSYLFPDRSEDLIYQLLLAAPFEIPRQVNAKMGAFGPYVRSIDVPEYDYEFNKRIGPSVAFYYPQYFVGPGDITNSVLVRAPDSFLHHVDVGIPDTIDSVLRLLGDNKSLIVEADGLLCLPTYHEKTIYLKGAIVERVDGGIISISGLMVDHPGSVCKGFGGDVGWHYKTGKGIYERFEHKDDWERSKCSGAWFDRISAGPTPKVACPQSTNVSAWR